MEYWQQVKEWAERKEKIKFLRQKKGLSWAQIAREMGISRQRVMEIVKDDDEKNKQPGAGS
jgi:transcriptional regulator with XRE-family HTH domain